MFGIAPAFTDRNLLLISFAMLFHVEQKMTINTTI